MHIRPPPLCQFAARGLPLSLTHRVAASRRLWASFSLARLAPLAIECWILCALMAQISAAFSRAAISLTGRLGRPQPLRKSRSPMHARLLNRVKSVQKYKPKCCKDLRHRTFAPTLPESCKSRRIPSRKTQYSSRKTRIPLTNDRLLHFWSVCTRSCRSRKIATHFHNCIYEIRPRLLHHPYACKSRRLAREREAPK
jgi:hypothetical protein